MNIELNKQLLNQSSVMLDQMKQGITESNFYCKNVKKAEWPKNQGYAYQISYQPASKPDLPTAAVIALEVPIDVTTRQIMLRKSAFHSPDICLDCLREVWQVNDVLKQTTRVMQSNAEWVWSNAFQNDILANCDNKVLARELTKPLLEDIILRYHRKGIHEDLTLVSSPQGPKSNTGVIVTHKVKGGLKAEVVIGIKEEFVQNPPRINFWGKRVYPCISSTCTEGYKCIVNPKYKKAAEQMIVFHPDICEFLFPDLENWIGDLMYRNIPDRENNPQGTIGFFRMLMAYGVKPERPDLGTVITVLPPGLKGWLWYWAWKLVGFQP